ncbi:hypothetical protein CF319_g7977 [Tilletia indica]|uniref:Uncharacterized protein n=1 Tax=Tilletia indica TaxID=43049 RepID=A0A177T929_9BASI|nr:hypothetical protein CF319_g7977 [Tilletia indica]KAE8228894.1 hypothetical protein CF326_g6152 [Tilletia indica]KAE8241497.1 hypothetical protein A4X13_0g7389 [Tilletia indica]
MSSANNQNGLTADHSGQVSMGPPDAPAPNPVTSHSPHASPNQAAISAAAQQSHTQTAITAANRAVDAARRAAAAADTVREVRARAKALRDRANLACRDADEAEAVLAAAESASSTANQEVVDAALSAALSIDPSTSRGNGDTSVGSAADVSNDLDNYAAARSIAAHLGLAVPHSPGSGASGLPASSRAAGASAFSMGEPSNTSGLSNLSNGTPIRSNGSIHNPTANIAALRAIGAQLGVNLSSPSSMNNGMMGSGLAGTKRSASHLPPPMDENDTIARRKARHSLEITSNHCADCESKVSRQWRRFDGDMCCHTCYQRRWRKRKAEEQDAGVHGPGGLDGDHGGDAASAATASAAAAAAHLQQQLSEPLSQISAQSMGHPHYLDNSQPEPPHPFES